LVGDKSAKLEIDAKGPGEVKAKDIKTGSDVEIVNSDLHIASLADGKTKLNIEMTAEKGVGFLPVESRRSLGIGTIPLDANFSPVTKVNYQVEATRVGRVTNFDKLTLEITTDGTIKPSEALKQAAKILVDHFLIVNEPKTNTKKQKTKADSDSVKLTEEVLNTSLEELDLPVRLTNSLRAGKIDTIGDFLDRDKKELMKMKNMGPKSISLVEEKLSERGISFK